MSSMHWLKRSLKCTHCHNKKKIYIGSYEIPNWHSIRWRKSALRWSSGGWERLGNGRTPRRLWTSWRMSSRPTRIYWGRVNRKQSIFKAWWDPCRSRQTQWNSRSGPACTCRHNNNNNIDIHPYWFCPFRMSSQVLASSINVVWGHARAFVCTCHCTQEDACVRICAWVHWSGSLNLFSFLSALYLLRQATNESSLLRRNLIWMNLTAAAKVRRAECHFNPINFNLLVIKELGCWRMAVSQALYYTG